MSKRNLEIHTQNILPIIKKWLYSDKDIFVRELVSNACDAISKRKILNESGKSSWEEPRISLKIDTIENCLTIEDTGLGMDEDELVRYLSQVAFSSAEEFMSHYESAAKDQIIGHFGLGFYSSFMVAKKVVVESLSYKEGAKAARWSCDGSVEYEIESCDRSQVGTRLCLYLDESSQEYLEASRLEEILKRFCQFMPYSIYLNDQKLNQYEPLWLASPKDCQKEQYLEFFHQLYPSQPDPLFWVHLDVDYPFRLKGILYFPSMNQWKQAPSDSIQLYSNRVFVSEGCKDILPEYLLPLKGALDSPDIPLNVSRSALQMDATVRKLSAHISKKVADCLKEIQTKDPEHFQKAWPELEIVVKWGAMSDEKFLDRVYNLIQWPLCSLEEAEQKSWVKLSELATNAESSTPTTVYYASESMAQSSLAKAHLKNSERVICIEETIDMPFFSFLESKKPLKFVRLDANAGQSLIDSSREETLLDESGQTLGARLEKLFLKGLSFNATIHAKSLIDDSLPVIISQDEQQRRFEDYMKRQGIEAGAVSVSKIILNTNSPLVRSLEKLSQKDPDLATELCQEVVSLARLNQEKLSAQEKEKIVSQSWSLLEKITSRLS